MPQKLSFERSHRVSERTETSPGKREKEVEEKSAAFRNGTLHCFFSGGAIDLVVGEHNMKPDGEARGESTTRHEPQDPPWGTAGFRHWPGAFWCGPMADVVLTAVRRPRGRRRSRDVLFQFMCNSESDAFFTRIMPFRPTELKEARRRSAIGVSPPSVSSQITAVSRIAARQEPQGGGSRSLTHDTPKGGSWKEEARHWGRPQASCAIGETEPLMWRS